MPPVRNGVEAASSLPADPQEVTKRNLDGSAALHELVASTFGGKWVSQPDSVGADGGHRPVF